MDELQRQNKNKPGRGQILYDYIYLRHLVLSDLKTEIEEWVLVSRDRVLGSHYLVTLFNVQFGMMKMSDDIVLMIS